MHSSIQHVHHNSWNSRYNCRDETIRSTYLWWRMHLATSYVAATFHPTIGQRAHQSLNNIATLELGMIPQGIRVSAGLHIANVCQSVKPTHSRVYQVVKELGQAKCQAGGLNTSLLMHTQPLIPLSTVRRPTTAYRSKTIPSQLSEEGKDNQVPIPTNRWNNSSPQDKLELFWALAWPKQLSTTTQNQGTSIATTP